MAKFNTQDKDWLPAIVKQGVFTETEKALLLSAFDEQTTYDINSIKEQMKKERQARRVCLYKVIMYPFELILAKLLLGNNAVDEKRTMYKIYKSYYKKKISYIEFKKRLANFYKDVNISTRV